MIYRQVHLERENTHQVLWVDCEKKFNVGSRVRLKDRKEWWHVVYVSMQEMEKKEINNSKTWKHGGLKKCII